MTGSEGALAPDAVLLISRLLLGAIFLWSGFGKLTALSGFTAGMEAAGVPMAGVMAPLGAAAEFLGGLALILGAWTRLAALALVVFTVVATLIAHRFWAVAPEQAQMQTIQFMKNLAIVGGLFALVSAGGGRYGVDGFRQGRRESW
ncbi:DoxX family protein [Azospirillum sp. RWY-5-1]|uniref:DoxX family protein n=2 Tax=Azospirillum oleiclasticum TaxID=2735135 RepID=A0ABX2T3F5_9PROT|nr:DoxX family protein [Azospirillum oleiclasticum]NYZ18840.1 DoxX family protein [Azospirillum oleiclasticum]